MTQVRNLPKGRYFGDQFERMNRYYERFKKINDGKLISVGMAESDFDDVLAFFMNCDHLLDWVINDCTVNKSHPNYPKYLKFKKKVTDFRNGEDCLKLCADISVGAKHLLPNRKSHFGEETALHEGAVRLEDTENGTLIARSWDLPSGSGKKYDAFALATQCVTKWFDFLQTHETQIREIVPYWQEEHDTFSVDPTMIKGNVIESRYVTMRRARF
ncbi:hypothetical protein [Methanoregula sp.]|jgi:hypothetical protein|uniref:hypothetical protein n=1 Tax=Methanoregula sp. TaxID=2052170 RepID=UPI003C13FC3E